MPAEIIDLSDAPFIGKGAHKKVFQDPRNPGRCIKVPFSLPDTDIERELAYRECPLLRSAKGNRSASMLPQYFGTCRTSLGTGYVFELIRDYDGRISRTLQELLEEAEKDPKKRPSVRETLRLFKRQYFSECIVTSNVEPVNFLVQRVSPDRTSVRIIDNIGSPGLIPLAYYFHCCAALRARRHWRRLLEEISEHFPEMEAAGF
ncbi:YrbL family protein [Mesosutterella sp. AGMB02718]|uniref:YrbL family protein n=1 Tax=Mesosutterella faecium TaxID=2925194 RepID=A0ABT7ILB9_9BURK|nr:YrbL family protein [Mesosutterella sp. AGMB02718]MDL2059156.1 YrbL family protein [Mesosutterella sp. AGMB02718]